MQRALQIADLVQMFVSLGMDSHEVQVRLTTRDFNQLVRAYKELLEDAHAYWKRKAFECHPDRNAGDDAEMKKLNATWEFLKTAKLSPPPRPRNFRVVYQPMGMWSDTSTTSASSDFCSNSFYQVYRAF
jgi:hypothetical protein